jgi:hypothetical protein
VNVIGGKDIFPSVLIIELRWLVSRINLFYRSLFVMVMFHDTQIVLYFTSNYCCSHAHFYKNSLPEEQLPSFSSIKYNIAVDTEDDITVYVLLCACASRQPYISLDFRA